VIAAMAGSSLTKPARNRIVEYGEGAALWARHAKADVAAADREGCVPWVLGAARILAPLYAFGQTRPERGIRLSRRCLKEANRAFRA